MCAAAAAAASHQPGLLEEIIHNLDYCDILVLGEELKPELESLQLQRSILLGKHLDATNSTSGMSIYGQYILPSFSSLVLFSLAHCLPHLSLSKVWIPCPTTSRWSVRCDTAAGSLAKGRSVSHVPSSMGATPATSSTWRSVRSLAAASQRWLLTLLCVCYKCLFTLWNILWISNFLIYMNSKIPPAAKWTQLKHLMNGNVMERMLKHNQGTLVAPLLWNSAWCSVPAKYTAVNKN